jgi:hypothetical protein
MKKACLVLTLLGLVLLVPNMAKADGTLGLTDCSNVGGGTPITLDNTNWPGFSVMVTLCQDSNTITVGGVSWVGLPTSLMGLDMVFWNGSAATALGAGTSSGWTVDSNCTGAGAPPCNADGFGDFFGSASSPGDPGNVGLTWVFNGDPGDEFAVHLRFGGDCSTFVSNADYPGTNGTNSNCTPVPEPATLTLLGTGLLGLAGVVRKRLGKKA